MTLYCAQRLAARRLERCCEVAPLRVTRPGGRVLVSTHADRFWPHRLAWFEAQAAEGLLGPIDRERSGNGVIACTDGFRSGRLTPEGLSALCSDLGVAAAVTEADGSPVIAEIVRPLPPRRQ